MKKIGIEDFAAIVDAFIEAALDEDEGVDLGEIGTAVAGFVRSEQDAGGLKICDNPQD